MSSTMISSHIPDLDLITLYAQRQDTFFSRVSPWTTFAGLLLVILLITLTRNLVICGALYLVILGIYATAGSAGKKTRSHGIPSLVLFVLSLVGIYWRGASRAAPCSHGILGFLPSRSRTTALSLSLRCSSKRLHLDHVLALLPYDHTIPAFLCHDLPPFSYTS
ncbi:MAG: hypothetical protein MZU97_02925 [Bacillus subtilis]|nr:hypothetical protein [Bacillus subtilis]